MKLLFYSIAFSGFVFLLPISAKNPKLVGNTGYFISEVNKNYSTTKSVTNDSDKIESLTRLKRNYPIKEENGKLLISVMIEVSDKTAQNDLDSLDVSISNKIGKFWTIRIPIQNVRNLQKVNGIKTIKVSSKIKKKLDKVRIETKSNLANIGQSLKTSYKGSGVIIGVIDMGFDCSNPDFLDANKNLRIKRVWDQNGTGTAPSGFSYGRELTTSTNIKSFIDNTEFHATHVSGIAGGIGYGDTTYRGNATEADFAFVSCGDGDLDIVDGMAYLISYAKSVGKPIVINMSLGSHYIYNHDGNSIIDQAFDSLVYNTTGVALVGAAGNEGSDYVHVKKEFTKLDTMACANGYTSSDGNYYSNISLNHKVRNMKFRISLVNSNLSPYYTSDNKIAATDYITVSDTTSLEKTITINYSSTKTYSVYFSINSNNIDSYYKSSRTQLYSLIEIVGDSGTVHLWNANDEAFSTNSTKSHYVNPDNDYSVGEIGGTGKSVISVGAYSTKDIWNSGLVYGNIAYFSSHGPTVDGRMKPDISAPGYWVCSSAGSSSIISSDYSDYVQSQYTYNNKTYYYANLAGTSMATPVVTGAIALMFQANPYLSFSEVRSILKSTATKDSFTGSDSSNVWGAGKINIYEAVKKAELINTHTGINDSNNEGVSKLLIYPNPCSDYVYINYEDKNISDIGIIDLSGRIIYLEKCNSSKVEINTSSISDGIYIIKAYIDGKWSSQKIFIKH